MLDEVNFKVQHPFVLCVDSRHFCLFLRVLYWKKVVYWKKVFVLADIFVYWKKVCIGIYFCIGKAVW